MLIVPNRHADIKQKGTRCKNLAHIISSHHQVGDLRKPVQSIFSCMDKSSLQVLSWGPSHSETQLISKRCASCSMQTSDVQLTVWWKCDLEVTMSHNKVILWQSAHLPPARAGSSWILSFQVITERECLVVNDRSLKKGKCVAVAQSVQI